MKKLSYWEQRAIENEEKIHREATEVSKVIAKAHYESQEYLKNETAKLFNRAVKETGLAPEKMASVLKGPTPIEELAKLAPREKEALAYKGRISRLDVLKVKAHNTVVGLGEIEKAQVDNLLTNTVKQAYKETQEVIGTVDKNGFFEVSEDNIDSNKTTIRTMDGKIYQQSKEVAEHKGKFKELPTKSVQNILNSRWKGSNYSKRIWQDTEALSKRLEELFVEKNLTGMTEREIRKQIERVFSVSSNVASRLVRTESNYVYNQGKLKGWLDYAPNGKYRFVAILDERTSMLCKNQEGKTYKIKEAKVGENFPPMHPNCRSTVVLEVGDYSSSNDELTEVKEIDTNKPTIRTMDGKVYQRKGSEIVEGKKVANTSQRVYNASTRNQLDKHIPYYTGISGVSAAVNKSRFVNKKALPNYKNAVISDSKLIHYSLDMNNERGRNKAILFKDLLGFEKNNYKELRKQVIEKLPFYEAIQGPEDEYGKRYSVIMDIVGMNGKTKKVLTAWINDTNGNTRMTTIRIVKKKKKRK